MYLYLFILKPTACTHHLPKEGYFCLATAKTPNIEDALTAHMLHQ